MTSVQICVCTWNRSSALQHMLDSVWHLETPADCDWEILLVDNNSQDDTAAVARDWQSRLPLKYFCELAPGHVAARNCAVRHSTAELLLWTDDDVIVSSDWLSAYVAAARQSPQHSFWGGRIVPEFEIACPAWIQQNWSMVQGCFAARDLGPEPLEFTPKRLPYGANFAVRGDLQRQQPFTAGFGRVGTAIVGHDEIQWMRQAIGAGHRGHWIPGGEVRHRIPPERMTADYVFDYFRGQGQMLVHEGTAWTRWRWWLKVAQRWHRWNFGRYRDREPSGRWLAHLIRAGLAQGQLDVL